jgi:hypothetical protein
MRFLAIGFLATWLAVTGLSTAWGDCGQPKLGYAPEVKEGIIAIEGHPQNFILRRVDGDPMPYYTYVPHDMAVERFAEPEGTGFRFWLSRGGENRRNDAYATIFVFPPGTTSEETRQIIDDLMSRSGWDRHEPKYQEKKAFPGSLYELSYTTAWYSMGSHRLPIGFISVGKHGDLYFCVMNHFPREFGDGFIPRYMRIVQEFVWTDTNEKLR